ncbi:hypothetical protein [Qipengyuania sp. ASV99]|uniref:hypothetical protein n=1 Tax=Qipengyuania sp. ASV99 TaxID=3399681 RepID=UPI003A4C7AB9
MSSPFTVAAIGCSGHVTQPFIEGFVDLGVTLRILARRSEEVRKKYPHAEIIGGSMMDAGGVERVAKGVDAVFLVTPMRSAPIHPIDALRLGQPT